MWHADMQKEKQKFFVVKYIHIGKNPDCFVLFLGIFIIIFGFYVLIYMQGNWLVV
jgi:hypothetical protein